MLKHALRTFHLLADVVRHRFGMGLAHVDQDLSPARDAWLFEDIGIRYQLNTLPDFPALKVQTEGEAHRLELLEETVRAVRARLADLRRYTGAAETVQLASRSADPIVTDMLFETIWPVQEIDSDLFDLNMPARQTCSLPAWTIGHIQSVGTGRNHHSGG